MRIIRNVDVDQLVPDDYLVRKLESAIDFSFIYPLVKNLYSEIGRPSIDPVVLFKMIFIKYIFRIRSMRHTYEIKQIYAKRKETIERVFADAKEKHGIRWTTLRGLKKLSMQAMLTFAAMNLKKLATWTWQVA
jgi:hypothetical protein